MCMSWKCLFSMMNVKNRRLSLDSHVCLDGVGLLGVRRGSSRFSSKTSRQCQSLDDARQEIQELNHSLNTSMSLRDQSIAEENLDRSDGLIQHNTFLKHNKTFHKLFQDIPDEESLTQSFTCALQKEVPYHGKLFVSESHVCFYSSVLLRDTKVVIPVSSVRQVKKYNPALSMLSIQTVEGEKYSFVSLRHREMCYKLLQTVCSNARSPHLSENEADHDMPSSYSSLEDCAEHGSSAKDVFYLEDDFPQMSSEDPTKSTSTRQNSVTDEGEKAESWIWRIIERVTPFFFLREMTNLIYLYMMLMVLLLLVSGYIGLRIIALEEQLNTLGALTELYQKT